jgi:hypothetical protein
MDEILKRIKRCVMDDRIRLTYKARSEMIVDELTEQAVLESIFNAEGIFKKVRSTSLLKGKKKE